MAAARLAAEAAMDEGEVRRPGLAFRMWHQAHAGTLHATRLTRTLLRQVEHMRPRIEAGQRRLRMRRIDLHSYTLKRTLLCQVARLRAHADAASAEAA